MLLRASVNTYEKFTQEELDGLNAAIHSPEKYSFNEDGKGTLNWMCETPLMDVRAATVALGDRHTVVVHGIPNEAVTWEQLLVRLNQIEQKLDRPSFTREQSFNERVRVHVSDSALMKVVHVKVMTDLCTERLQEFLDEGWRIIAVCPQPDQRRPDYVLGTVASNPTA